MADYNKYAKIIEPEKWTLQNCRGNNDGGHPEWIAHRAKQLFELDPQDERKALAFKPLNQRENAQRMYDYVKLLFKIMYRHMKQGNEGHLTADLIDYNVYWCLGII